MSETAAFVLEIGCEEIPARFLEGAERDLGERLGSALLEARLLAQNAPAVKTASTPRRLLAYVPALLRAQPDRVEQLTGPPVKAAFDKEGKPARAAESFAAKNKAQVSDLKRVTTPKGEYLALEVAEAGKPAFQVLVEVLPSVLGGMTFPKNMYWTAKAGPLFVRPIRWILALLDEGRGPVVVPFEFAGVKSGNLTYGHRLQGSQPVAVTDLNLDLLLEKHLVAVHAEKRRERARQGIKALVEESGFKAAADEWLETWVVNSTEWPVPLAGGFDPRYLALPREVLVTVMRDHQKYFAVEDEAGNLQPQFITVLNVPGDPKGLIRQGHERVLAARFADAEFFWNADQKVSLRNRLPMLDRVTYHERLGSYRQKVERMKRLAGGLVGGLHQQGRLDIGAQSKAEQGALYSKCDLTTHMVQEFPELQGIVGGLIAKKQRESGIIADAIYDHYRPVNAHDESPRSLIGAAVSFADKLDAVAAGFALGLEPTGSSDPFGLRRQANGVIKIFWDYNIDSSLRPHIVGAIDGLTYVLKDLPFAGTPAGDNLVDRIVAFFKERVGFFLDAVEGLPYDVARAALEVSGDNNRWHAFGDRPWNIRQRAVQCNQVRSDVRFLNLCRTAKRIRNILTKSASGAAVLGSSINPNLLAIDQEQTLAAAVDQVEHQASALASQQKFSNALMAIAELSEPVDRFFEKVLVMDNDPLVRENRLRLLNRLNDILSSLVDFSQIVTESSEAPTIKSSQQ